MKEIIEKLRKQVAEKGLEQVGRELGYSISAISHWVNGKRKPTGENLLVLMKKLR